MAVATDAIQAGLDHQHLIGRRGSTGVRPSPAMRGVLHPATAGSHVGGGAP